MENNPVSSLLGICNFLSEMNFFDFCKSSSYYCAHIQLFSAKVESNLRKWVQ